MIKIEKGDGRTRIAILAENTGQGVAVLLTGGEREHVGGVVLAVPRKSLSGEGTSADIYVIPVPGHKDVEAAIPLAKRICALTCQPVSVTAGIHMEGALPKEIDTVMRYCEEASDELAKCILQNEGSVCGK